MNLSSNKLTKAIIFLAATMTLSIGASERLVLDMSNAHYRGQNKVIKLKREISRQYGHSNLQNSKLVSVKLVAKSKHGGGSAALYIGGSEHDRTRVAGTPYKFQTNRPNSYHRAHMTPMYRRTPGAWQLRLDGNIKVKKIVIHIERNRRPHRPLQFIEIGSSRAPKLVEEIDSFRISQGAIERIVIKGDGAKVSILRVVAEMADGSQERLYSLEGTVRGGDQLTTRLHGQRVYKLWVTATSPGLFGSRGKYRVEVGVRR